MSTTIGTVLIDLQADTTRLVEGMNRAERAVGNSIDTMRRTVLGLTAAYLSFEGVANFSNTIKGAIDAADATGKLAEKLAISTESLSKMQYAAGFAAVSVGDLNSSMSAMIRRTGNFKKDGTGAAAKAMAELGISVETARKEFTDTETTFKYLLDALGKVEDGTLKTKLAQDVFSKSAAGVVRLANMGTKALDDLGEQGRKTGAVISNDMAMNAAILNDNLDTFHNTINGITNSMATDLLPGLVAVTEELKNTENVEILRNAAAGFTDILISSAGGVLRFVNGIKLTFQDIGYYSQTIVAGGSLIVDELSLKFLEFARDARLALVDAVGISSAKKLGVNVDFTEQTKQIAQVEQSLHTQNTALEANRLEWAKNKKEGKEFNQLVIDMVEKFKNPIDVEVKANTNANSYNPNNYDTPKKATGKDTTNANLIEYYEMKEQYADAWALKEVEYAEKYSTLTKERALELIAFQKTEYFDKFKEELREISDLENITLELDLNLKDIDKKLDALEMPNIDISGLNNVEKAAIGVTDAYLDMSKTAIEGNKAQIQSDAELAKVKAEFGEDSIEYAEAQERHTYEYSDLQQKTQTAEIAGYANLAGAMASAFEKGSAGAKAFQAIQATLGIVNAYTAITTAWASAPFPANLPAVAATLPAVIPIISTLTSLGGSSGGGGGGSSAPTISDAQFEQEMIKSEGTLVTDLLQRQVELLEMIGENGTADNIQRRALESQYNMDRDVFLSELKAAIPNRASYKWNYTDEQWESRVSQYERVNKNLGFDLYSLDQAGGVINTNTGLMQNPMEVMLELYKENLAYNLSNHDELDFYSPDAKKQAELLKANSLAKISELQEITNDYILGLGDLASNMAEARENMEDSYDEISGTNKFAKERLVNAFEEMGNIAGGTDTASIEKFLLGSIEDIQKFNNLFTESVKDIFSSQDPKDLEKQRAELEKINKEMGKTYITSAEEALNMADAIDLVTEALTISRENTEDFINSRKTEYQLTKELGEELGVLDLAQNEGDLIGLFNTMSRGIDGFNDAEAEFIDANSSLIDSLKDVSKTITDVISDITDSIAKEDLTDIESLQYDIASAREDIASIVNSSYVVGKETKTIDTATGTFETGNIRKDRQKLVEEIYADIMEDTGFVWDTTELQEGIDYWTNNSETALEDLIETITKAFKESDGIDFADKVDVSDLSIYNDEIITKTEKITNIYDVFFAGVNNLDSAISKLQEIQLDPKLMSNDDLVGTATNLVELFNNIRELENNIVELNKETNKNTAEIERIVNETNSLKIELSLAKLLGDEEAYLNLQRQNTLDTIDESNRSLQEEIWLYEDLDAAKQDAISNLKSEISAYESVADAISGTLDEMNGVKILWSDIVSKMNSIDTAEDADEVFNMLNTYYSEQEDLLSKQTEAEKESLNSKIETLQAEQDILNTFKDFYNDLRTEDLTENNDTLGLKGLFTSTFDELKEAVAAGIDTGDLASETTSYASSYLDSLKNTSKSTAEYSFERSVLMNELRDYKGTGRTATLDTLNEQLDKLNETEDEIYDLTYLQEANIDELKWKTNDMFSILDDKVATSLSAANSKLNDIEDLGEDYMGEGSVLATWLETINSSTVNLGTILAGLNFNSGSGNVVHTTSGGGSITKEDNGTYTAVGEEGYIVNLPANLGAGTTVNVGAAGGGEEYTIPEPAQTEHSGGFKDRYGNVVNTEYVSDNVLADFIDKGIFTPFANGGIVTAPTLGLVGEAGYNEAVIPLKDPNDPLQMKGVIAELNALRQEVSSLRADNNTYLRDIEDNTRESRFVGA